MDESRLALVAGLSVGWADGTSVVSTKCAGFGGRVSEVTSVTGVALVGVWTVEAASSARLALGDVGLSDFKGLGRTEEGAVSIDGSVSWSVNQLEVGQALGADSLVSCADFAVGLGAGFALVGRSEVGVAAVGRLEAVRTGSHAACFSCTLGQEVKFSWSGRTYDITDLLATFLLSKLRRVGRIGIAGRVWTGGHTSWLA